jgi:hypothetical protein
LGGAALTVVQATTGVAAARIAREMIAERVVLPNMFRFLEMEIVQQIVGREKQSSNTLPCING